MKTNYRVELLKEDLTFSAAHFITFASNVCERIHGHNYGVRCTVEGPLDENQYVIDFIALRDALKQITNSLDHHVLLPMHHPAIHVTEAVSETHGSEVIATFESRRWVFPKEDCILLPVENTTAELIARWIGNELIAKIDLANSVSLEVAVDENQGQWAVCRFEF